MAWLKMRTNLWGDPRVLELVEKTKTTEATVIGGLYWLWSTADEHTEDGFLQGISQSSIDRKTGIVGFGAALVGINWLEFTDGCAEIKRFSEHNGKSAKARAQGAIRSANCKSNALVTLPPLPEREHDVSDASPRERVRERKDYTSSDEDVVAMAGEPRAKASGKTPCPHAEIIAIYHELLPSCPEVRVWTPARSKHLAARWSENQKRQNLGWWRDFFEFVSSCPFLVGKRSGRDSRPFFARLDWLVKAENFAKVLEEVYVDVQ